MSADKNQVAQPPGLAEVFAALGDPTRLQLVSLLCAGGLLSIAQLTLATDISRQGVTKHLQVLADAGLVRDVKLGRERRWQLAPERIDEARRAWKPSAASGKRRSAGSRPSSRRTARMRPHEAGGA
jgi:DNA-binding transcriptional ArsR family regulator